MKTPKFIHALLPVTTFILGVPVTSTVLHAQAVESAVASAKGDAIKTQLKELDAQIDRLDELEAIAPTPDERIAAKARIDALKDRRNELRKNYVQARYDTLKADVKGEYNKLSAWTKKTFSNSSDAKLDRKLDEMNDQAKDATNAARERTNDAMASTNAAAAGTSSDLAGYKLNPSEEAKADVKASLATLDAEIERLDQRANALPVGDDRDAAKLRVKALKERRSELASDFRKARYDALKADVKAEWNKIVH